MNKSKIESSVSRPEPVVQPRILKVLPGVLAALLCVALLLRGSVGPLPAALLSLAFLGSLVALPGVHGRAHAAVRSNELPYLAALSVIIVGAAALRFTGIRFGLPYLEHPDEWATADPALRMLKTADYNPGSFVYPSLTTYLQLGVAALHFLWGAGAGLYTTVNDVAPVHFYPWARGFTALLGTMSVALTFVIGRRLYGRGVGLLGALLMAVYPAATGDAHYITTDTPAMFFTLLAFLAIISLVIPNSSQVQAVHVERDARAFGLRVLLAGVAVGLATATKYNVAVLVLPLVVALVFRRADENHQDAARNMPFMAGLPAFALALLGVAAGFTLGTPYWLPQLPQLLNDLASIVIHYKITGHPGAEADVPALFYWDAALANGWLLAWAFLAGLGLAFVRHRRADVLILAFVVPSLLQLASVRVVFFRNTMPVLPFLCLLAAALVASVAGVAGRERRTLGRNRFHVSMSRSQLAIMVLTLLLAVQPLGVAAHDEWLRTRPTTRVLATNWVEEHVAPGALLWMEDHTLTVSSRFRVRGGEPVTTHPPEWYRENGFDYLVVDRDARVRKQDAAELTAFGEPVVSFDSNGERHGPMFSIYATGLNIAADPRTPSGASLGRGALTLDGYAHPAEVAAGATLPLALYWKANQPLPADYTVFVHLVDAQGNKLAQRDTPPLDGARPTTTWQPGELLRDNADLAIPAGVPAGTYTLLVGMYDAQTMAGINDSGPIPVGEVTVTTAP